MIPNNQFSLAMEKEIPNELQPAENNKLYWNLDEKYNLHATYV